MGLKDYVLTIGDISILDEILDKLRFPLNKRNKLKDILSSRSKSDLSEYLKQEGKGKRTLTILSNLLDIVGDYDHEFKNLNLICRELKIDPKKNIMFSPEDSIDFNGNTGPFIHYTYVRIKSILYKNDNTSIEFNHVKLAKKEKELIIMLCEFKNVLNNSVKTLNPSLIANHIYELVKMYNSYYQTHTILGDKSINSFRVFLSEKVAFQIKKSMSLLGVSVPDRM